MNGLFGFRPGSRATSDAEFVADLRRRLDVLDRRRGWWTACQMIMLLAIVFLCGHVVHGLCQLVRNLGPMIGPEIYCLLGFKAGAAITGAVMWMVQSLLAGRGLRAIRLLVRYHDAAGNSKARSRQHANESSGPDDAAEWVSAEVPQAVLPKYSTAAPRGIAEVSACAPQYSPLEGPAHGRHR